MAVIIGFALVLILVFTGYYLAGGTFHVLLHALPHEMMTIGGAALGSFIIANQGTVVKATLKAFGTLFKGAHWKKNDYRDLLTLLFTLLTLIKQKGMLAVEPHIEDPHQSDIFSKYPRIAHDHFAIDFICDQLRLVSMSLEDPHQVEDSMQRQLEKHHHEHAAPSHALQTVADGVPALGIVAAVLGVIKTMSSISEPPEVLGGMIGGALVGTFLGVFLAYTMFGPMASRLGQIYNEEQQFYFIIRDVLVSHLYKNAPQVSVEIGRANVPTHMQPSFKELEQALEESRKS